MNSVMDMNKTLTLASNERIPLKPHMRMLFEMRDLAHASLATVTRAGVLYVKSIFVVHVGCTRCVTSNTDHNMQIQARITLSVEFIRTCIYFIHFILCVNTITSMITTNLFFDFTDFQVHQRRPRPPMACAVKHVGESTARERSSQTYFGEIGRKIHSRHVDSNQKIPHPHGPYLRDGHGEFHVEFDGLHDERQVDEHWEKGSSNRERTGEESFFLFFITYFVTTTFCRIQRGTYRN